MSREGEESAYLDAASNRTGGMEASNSGNETRASEGSSYPQSEFERLLPEETVRHLKNAGREALLALYSLWQSIDAARQGKPVNKVRKRIDVE